MPSFYWFKLYDEILDDPKMGKMPDRLYRRSIEMMAFANRFNQEGKLPPVDDMAWVLHCDEDELRAEMKELASDKYQILTWDGDDCFVTQFAKRQERVSDVERQRRKRERDKKDAYYGNEVVTEKSHGCHEDVTDRDTELEIELEIDRESEETGALDLFSETQRMIESVVCVPPNGEAGIEAIREIMQMGATMEDIQGGFDWLRGQGGRRPVTFYSSLVGPVRTAMAQRLQKRNGKQSEDPMKGYTPV